MGEHRGRLDPLGGGAEEMAIVRRRRAPLYLEGVAVVRRDAPAVGMLEAANKKLVVAQAARGLISTA
jgi:hypothetical protein